MNASANFPSYVYIGLNKIIHILSNSSCSGNHTDPKYDKETWSFTGIQTIKEGIISECKIYGRGESLLGASALTVAHRDKNFFKDQVLMRAVGGTEFYF